MTSHKNRLSKEETAGRRNETDNKYTKKINNVNKKL